jgi:TolB-like protein/tetratricopeptide (TPR) repeat protein
MEMVDRAGGKMPAFLGGIPVTDPIPPAALVREHLDRIVRSPAFAKANRLQAFLRFVVEQTLAGCQDTIKEYAIALEVCGRPATFDAKTDPIVRVDANRLRVRLDAYYRLDGHADSIRIHLPKGSYVPAITSAAPLAAPTLAASLAVLPLVDLGPERDDRSFADGLAEELIHRLSTIPALRVIARASAFRYRSKDVRRIAADLGVAYIVEGSVRSAGQQIRVTVQLVATEDCGVRWSGRYERELSDVFAVQDDICRSIATALELQLATPAGVVPRTRPEPRAHIEYLKGRHFWNRRTANSLAQSLEHYGRAIDLDPHYAPAHCGIADTLVVQALNEQVGGTDALAQARAHCDEALRLAPDLAETLASAAAVASVLEWDWVKGDALFRKAVNVNPRRSLSHYLHAILNLAPRACWEPALIAMDHAIELDPVSPVLHRDLGIVHYLRGEFRQAEEALQAASALDPAFRGSLFWRGRALAEQGRYDDALRMFQARLAEPGANTRVRASVVHTLALMGRQAEALEQFEQLQQEAAPRRVPALNLAIAHLGLGQRDEALAEIERACARHAVPLYQLGVDPIFRPVRDTRRFQAILREMKLDTAATACT